METRSALVAPESIARRILLLRGQRVMLDAALAELYGVPTKRLNEQVRRNADRFPADFMFQLTEEEFVSLRSQIATSSAKHGGRRHLPFAFTEHGALMLGNVLRSDRAVEISLLVVRTFVQLREMLATHKELAVKLEALERKIGSHDQAIAGLIDAIRQLMTQPAGKSRPIGFTAKIGPAE
jgi:phage regulator Rha-like protein